MKEMPKGMPGTYDSSPVHGEPGNRHVDIYTRNEKGKAEEGSKQHIPAENWVWEKPDSQRDSGGSESKGVMGGLLSGIGNILKGGKVDDDP